MAPILNLRVYLSQTCYQKHSFSSLLFSGSHTRTESHWKASLCSFFLFCFFFFFFCRTYSHVIDLLWRLSSFFCVYWSIQCHCLWPLDSILHLPFWSRANKIESVIYHHSLLLLSTSPASQLAAFCTVGPNYRLMSTPGLSLTVWFVFYSVEICDSSWIRDVSLIWGVCACV